jgi:phenylalanyl-tRNA synthetase alpha chain
MAEEALLGFLQTEEQILDSQEFAASIGVRHTDLENVIKSLKGFEIVDVQVNINRIFLN